MGKVIVDIWNAVAFFRMVRRFRRHGEIQRIVVELGKPREAEIMGERWAK